LLGVFSPKDEIVFRRDEPEELFEPKGFPKFIDGGRNLDLPDLSVDLLFRRGQSLPYQKGDGKKGLLA